MNNRMTTEQLRYLVYMLRLWQVRDDDEILWRASLEDARTGERRGFASLELLIAFLRGETRANDTQTFEISETLRQAQGRLSEV